MKHGWEIKKLKDVTSLITDGDWIESRHQSEDGIRLIQTGNVGNGFFKAKDDKPHFISEETFNVLGCTEIFKSDCLVSRLPDPVGRACLIPEMDCRMITAVDCSIIRFNEILVPDFFVYYSQSSKYQNEISNKTTGTTRKRISRKNLEMIPIPVPPIAEQEKIVAELDCLSGIIEKKKQQLKELDNLAQSIFYEMFSNQDGTPVKLSQACSVVSGLVNPNDKPYCNYPHIGGANIESHSGKFVNVKLAKEENLISGKYPFDDTMILYSKIRPNLNKVALPSFKGICSADMYPLIPQNEFDKVFLKYILTQKVFLDYAISHSGRANIPKINREDLLNYEFLTYPITLQQDFASKIEAIEKQKELIAQSIKETETLFNSRMDYYF